MATEIYGADGIDLLPAAEKSLRRIEDLGFGHLPVCIAKTQYSLSHDPLLLGRPREFRVPIRDLESMLETLGVTPGAVTKSPARPNGSRVM